MSVRVAVGIVINAENQVLITKRSADQHQGNKWEFPGGKIEESETPQQALRRELKEEVGIDIQSSSFFTTIEHQYSDKKVTLEFYKVTKWLGEAKGLEGQPLIWVEKSALNNYEFPTANKAIVVMLV